jgi:hypothetical protein
VNPEFFISPAFFVILAVTVALLTVAVLWLMRDGPSARRAGMIDLTGVKPKGMTWDWPTAPNTVDEITRRALARAPSNVADTSRFVTEPEWLKIVEDFTRPFDEPERRPSFGV